MQILLHNDTQLFEKPIIFIEDGLKHANILIGKINKNGKIHGRNIIEMNRLTLSTTVYNVKKNCLVGNERTLTWSYDRNKLLPEIFLNQSSLKTHHKLGTIILYEDAHENNSSISFFKDQMFNLQTLNHLKVQMQFQESNSVFSDVKYYQYLKKYDNYIQ